FAHSTLNPVALDRPAQNLSHGEPHTQPAAVVSRINCRRPPQEKYLHVAGKLAATRPVNALKIRVPQQAPRLGKCAAGGVHTLHWAPNLGFVNAFGRESGGGSSHFILPRAEDAVMRAGIQRDATTRGNQASRRRACVPWRDGAKSPPVRSWSSCENEIRASLSGDDGWVGTCASALRNCAPHWL